MLEKKIISDTTQQTSNKMHLFSDLKLHVLSRAKVYTERSLTNQRSLRDHDHFAKVMRSNYRNLLNLHFFLFRKVCWTELD